MIPPASGAPRAFVLYAENDENDSFLMNVCWKRAAVAHALEVVGDGQAAIERLAEAAAGAGATPALLLLDLSMPRCSGLEALAWVRARPEFAALPVLIVSSSNQERDREEAGRLGADGYFVKPTGMAALVELIVGWRERWLAARPAQPAASST